MYIFSPDLILIMRLSLGSFYYNIYGKISFFFSQITLHSLCGDYIFYNLPIERIHLSWLLLIRMHWTEEYTEQRNIDDLLVHVLVFICMYAYSDVGTIWQYGSSTQKIWGRGKETPYCFSLGLFYFIPTKISEIPFLRIPTSC